MQATSDESHHRSQPNSLLVGFLDTQPDKEGVAGVHDAKRGELDECTVFLAKQPDAARARESLIRALFNHHEFITVR